MREVEIFARFLWAVLHVAPPRSVPTVAWLATGFVVCLINWAVIWQTRQTLNRWKVELFELLAENERQNLELERCRRTMDNQAGEPCVRCGGTGLRSALTPDGRMVQEGSAEVERAAEDLAWTVDKEAWWGWSDFPESVREALERFRDAERRLQDPEIADRTSRPGPTAKRGEE